MADKGKYGDNNIGIDVVEFKRKAKKLAKQFDLDEKEFIKDQSRLLAREAAKFTPPWPQKDFPDWKKGTAVARKQDILAGEQAVKTAITQICYTVDDWKVWQWREKYGDGVIYSKGVPVATGVITNGIKLYRWHQDNKNKYGRTKKLKPPNMPAVGKSLRDEYIKNMQKHVGVAKASLLKAAIDFGDKGAAPPKIKRHLGKVKGSSGKLNKKSKGYEGLIHAIAEGTYRTKQLIPHLMRNRLEKAHARLKILAREAAKKAEFKTT